MRVLLTLVMFAIRNVWVTRHPIYKEIGAIIRAKRKKLGLKQENLASELRISRGSLANIETGRQNMLVHQLYNFAKVLHLSPVDLLPALVENIGKLDRTELPLPGNLKGSQKEQVARFFSLATPKPKQEKEISHVKSSKR
jgi:transcriptional regulator with XRE-family HTH domain